jgi:hypothetical protein
METQQEPSRVQLKVEINSELYHRIETAARQKDLTVQEYLENILEQNVHSLRPVSGESIERLLQARERMMQERNGRPSIDSIEIIRQMREERSQYLEDL